MTEKLLDLDPALNRIPDSLRRIHLMGVCGTAMAALAGMLKGSGYLVSGSDQQVYPPMSDLLEQMGITLFTGYTKKNLEQCPDLVIVGNVIPKKNPEAQALAASGIPYLSLPQALSRFYIESRTSIVIAGTHGKTTTSSMLAAALFHAGCDPSFMIGGVVGDFQTNHRLGNGAHFIVEGDEYDTAFFDKESKFLHYRPEIAVITSIEFDHADIFADLEQIKRSFRKFVDLLPSDGLLIAHTDDPNVAEIAGGARCAVQSYGSKAGCDWRVSNMSCAPGRTTFDLLHDTFGRRNLSIALPGLHNCLNGAAVAAIMHHLQIPPADIADGMLRFQGVKRRQEVRGIVHNITVIDDFAHHPTAVQETLNGLKKAYKGRRLIAVFEPRSNTSRRSLFQSRYAESFDAADVVLIREPATDKPLDAHDIFSAEKLARELNESNKPAKPFPDTETIISHLVGFVSAGDVIAILSNGGFDNIHERLLKELEGVEA